MGEVLCQAVMDSLFNNSMFQDVDLYKLTGRTSPFVDGFGCSKVQNLGGKVKKVKKRVSKVVGPYWPPAFVCIDLLFSCALKLNDDDDDDKQLWTQH